MSDSNRLGRVIEKNADGAEIRKHAEKIGKGAKATTQDIYFAWPVGTEIPKRCRFLSEARSAVGIDTSPKKEKKAA